MSEPGAVPDVGGVLAYMAKNSVAANVVMLILIGGGLLMVPRITQEVFPQFELDLVLINVPYPGASPQEVEEGVVLPIEEAVRGVDGIQEARSTAQEGVGVVTLELLLGANPDRVLADVKSAVDRITSFPSDVEEPVVSRPAFTSEVISVVVYGDAEEDALRVLADRVREDLLADDRITTVELSGVRPLEISVEVPQANLRSYGLTLSDVSQSIRAASLDVPAGVLKTRQGEVLLRTTERRERGEEFRDIVVRSRPDGAQVTVDDLATVVDGFAEVDNAATYNGQRAVMVKVFRVGDQTPLELAGAVHEYIEEHESDLPPGVHYATWNDQSEIYRDRIDLLMRNAYMGLILVLICLGLFLEVRLAFWVTLGIPISFIGSMVILPFTDASINMISLFAFILTLGMVVDDAIVVGEAVFTKLSNGVPPMQAAVEGVKEVATPVIFAILTTCMAFAPLLFVPGVMGKFFMQIPIVVITVLLLSLVESLLVLPAHLAHLDGTKKWLYGISIVCLIALPVSYRMSGEWSFPLLFITGASFILIIATHSTFIQRGQQRFSKLVEWLIQKTYSPVLKVALRFRYVTLATAVALMAAGIGLVAGGRVEWTFFPKIDSDLVVATLTMPVGTPPSETEAIQQHMVEQSRAAVAELAPNAGEDTVRGRFALLGATGIGGGGPSGGASSSGGHITQVATFVVPSDQRPFTGRELSEAWREHVGDIPGVESLTFSSSTGGPSGAAIDFQLSHPNLQTLERAATQMAEGLASYSGVEDIDDGFAEGKEQLDFTLRPEARARGITEQMLARQLRDAFFGSEAVRQQRGRDEIRVYVRRPLAERTSVADVEELLIRTPEGGEIPLREAAQIHRGRSYTRIQRLDGRRRVNVTAETAFGTNANRVQQQAQSELVPQLLRQYPGLRIGAGGQAKRQAETMQALGVGFLMALIGMFALLAVAFKSYSQPLIIVTALPFGFVGAVLGHLALGYDLSLMSMMGLVALSGVVVNDSLVLVSAVNDFKRDEGLTVHASVVAGGTRRFRPILLTSLTTFLGLTPMILETSVGARFLIPMAISLGFGVLFATFITLLLVPSLYMIIEDLVNGVRKLGDTIWFGWTGRRPDAPAHEE
ncbi:MAG: efflux RND transporter permease subunit [Sandaracinaceae bacterium]